MKIELSNPRIEILVK